MKNTKKELESKAEGIIRLISGVINEEIDVPYNALVLDEASMTEIFTKKRLELIKLIEKTMPESVQELAITTNRKKQAVDIISTEFLNAAYRVSDALSHHRYRHGVTKTTCDRLPFKLGTGVESLVHRHHHDFSSLFT